MATTPDGVEKKAQAQLREFLRGTFRALAKERVLVARLQARELVAVARQWRRR